MRRLLAIAWHETSYDRGLKQLKTVAKWLDRLCPDAAASLRKGTEELLMVVKLQVPAKLRTALATTNPVESALSMMRRATCRVATWQDGDMRHRRCTAALLRAEARFNKLRGHTHLADSASNSTTSKKEHLTPCYIPPDTQNHRTASDSFN